MINNLFRIIQGWVKLKGATDGTFIGNVSDALKVTGNISVSTSDLREFFVEVSLGNIPGYSSIAKFGVNFDIDATTADIWDGGGTYPFPASAQTTKIVSDDEEDSLTGEGANKVCVMGLNSSYNLIEETVNMDGVDEVTLSNQYLRVYRAYVKQSGDQMENAGNIEIKHGDTVIAKITEGKSQTLMAVYTIPAGKKGVLVSWDAQVSRKLGANNDLGAEMEFIATPLGESNQVKDFRIIYSDGSQVSKRYYANKVFDEKTDLFVRATTDTQNSIVTSGFDLILVDVA